MYTEEEIVKNNILIAQFMGYEKDEDSPFYTIEAFNPRTYSMKKHHEEQLCFQLSWEWLMPVIASLDETFLGTSYKLRESINFSNILESYVLVLHYIKIYQTWGNNYEHNLLLRRKKG